MGCLRADLPDLVALAKKLKAKQKFTAEDTKNIWDTLVELSSVDETSYVYELELDKPLFKAPWQTEKWFSDLKAIIASPNATHLAIAQLGAAWEDQTFLSLEDSAPIEEEEEQDSSLTQAFGAAATWWKGGRQSKKEFKERLDRTPFTMNTLQNLRQEANRQVENMKNHFADSQAANDVRSRLRARQPPKRGAKAKHFDPETFYGPNADTESHVYQDMDDDYIIPDRNPRKRRVRPKRPRSESGESAKFTDPDGGTSSSMETDSDDDDDSDDDSQLGEEDWELEEHDDNLGWDKDRFAKEGELTDEEDAEIEKERAAKRKASLRNAAPKKAGNGQQKGTGKK